MASWLEIVLLIYGDDFSHGNLSSAERGVDSGWNRESMDQALHGFCFGSVILGVRQSLGVASVHPRVAMNTVQHT